jgi:hypothetical protein
VNQSFKPGALGVWCEGHEYINKPRGPGPFEVKAVDSAYESIDTDAGRDQPLWPPPIHPRPHRTAAGISSGRFRSRSTRRTAKDHDGREVHDGHRQESRGPKDPRSLRFSGDRAGEESVWHGQHDPVYRGWLRTPRPPSARPQAHKGWVNCYPDDAFSLLYSTRKVADDAPNASHYTEGEGQFRPSNRNTTPRRRRRLRQGRPRARCLEVGRHTGDGTNNFIQHEAHPRRCWRTHGKWEGRV